MCGPITSRLHAADLDAESDFADYLIATARSDPVKFIDVSRCTLFDTPLVGSLLSNHLEDSVRRHQKVSKDGRTDLLTRNNILPLICSAEKAGHVVVSIYSFEEGYSLSLKNREGKWIESTRMPYSHSNIIFALDNGIFPSELSDILLSLQPPVIRNGHLVAELRDYRPPLANSETPYDKSFHLLSTNVLMDKPFQADSSISHGAEKRLIDAICCDPRPAVYLVRSAYARHASQASSQKMAGVLKRHFKTSARKHNLPLSASSRVLFSIFEPTKLRNWPPTRAPCAISASQDKNPLLDLLEQHSLRYPCDEIFQRRTLQINGTEKFSEKNFIPVDEMVLKQHLIVQNFDVTTKHSQLSFNERFIRVRIYFSTWALSYSFTSDFSTSLARSLSMPEENQMLGKTNLGSQTDVIAYLKHFVTLLAAEGGGKVEVVHYKLLNKQFGLGLDRRGLKTFDQSSATTPERVILPSAKKPHVVVKDEAVESVSTSFSDEIPPGSDFGSDLSLFDRNNAPRTPLNSVISDHSSNIFVADAATTPYQPS